MSDDNLKKERENELKEAFDMFDRDKDSMINKRELGCVLRSIGQEPSEQDLSDMLADISKEDDSPLTFEDVMEIINKNLNGTEAEEELIEAFKVFDKEGNGLIPVGEFKHLMLTLGEKLPEEEVDEMIKEADPNNEGNVNYIDFSKRILMK